MIIEEWMWGMDEDAPKEEVGSWHAVNCRHEQKALVLNVLVEEVDGTEGKEGHGFLEEPLVWEF